MKKTIISNLFNRTDDILIAISILYLSCRIWQHATDSGILPNKVILMFAPYLLLVVPIIMGLGTDRYKGECHGYSAIGEQQYRNERVWAGTMMFLNIAATCLLLVCAVTFKLDRLACYIPFLLTFLVVGMVDLQTYSGSALTLLLGSYQYGVLHDFGLKGILILLGITLVVIFLIILVVTTFCSSVAMIDNALVALAALPYLAWGHYLAWLGALIVNSLVVRRIIASKTQCHYICAKPFTGIYACTVTFGYVLIAYWWRDSIAAPSIL